MKTNITCKLVRALLVAATLGIDASAAVTNVAWYRLGENDPGAASGQVVNPTTIDFVEGKHLKRVGSPRYTNHVSAVAADKVGSSLAVLFDGSSQFCSNGVVTTARNNFGIEAWVWPGTLTPGTYIIAYNGNTTANGWGIYWDGDSYSAALGGAVTFGSAGGTAGRWVHVALVRDSGTSTLYVNGVASGSNTTSPTGATGGFAIAASPQSPHPGLFPGVIDEVRVFTFGAGQFATDDLLVNRAASTWDGGGADNNWTTAANWVGDIAPLAGDDLVFPPGAARLSNTNNLPAGTVFNAITLSGTGYVLYGSNLVLNAGLNATADTTAENYFFISLTLNSNQTITTSNASVSLYLHGAIDTNGKDLTFAGNGSAQVSSVISGVGGLTKSGTGTLLLYSSNSFSGPVQIVQGAVNIYHGNALGATNGSTMVSNGAVLRLAGNVITIPEPLVLSGLLLSGGAGAKTLTGPVTLTVGGATIQVAPGAPLTINAVISGAGGFTKTFPDVLTLNGNNTYTGTTTLSEGTLGGTGTVGTITATGALGKTLAPGASPGILNASNVTFNASTTFAVELNGTTPGNGYDQLNVTGTVNLADCALKVLFGFRPAVGNSFVIINNDDTDAVTNTFAGLAEGALMTNFGTIFSLSYAGGSGNDVVLTVLTSPAASTWDGGGADNNWTTAANWVGDIAPLAGDDLVFPPGAARLSNTNNFPAGTVFNAITLSGTGYVLYGSNLVLNAGLNATTDTTAENYSFIPLTLNSNQTITTSNASVSLYLYGAIDTNGKDLTFAGNGSAQVSSVISGVGGLIKSGTGTLLLYSSNSFFGPVQIVQGAVNIYHGNALGAINGSTMVSNSAVLRLAGNVITIPEPLVLSGLLRSGGAGAKTLTGPVTLAVGDATIQVAPGAPLTINAVISGAGGFTKTFPDTLTLNGNNTYTGTTTLSEGTLGGTGTVGTITAAGALGKTLAPGASPGILNASNATFNVSTTFAVELNGTTPGTDYDQLNVQGTVNLAGAGLSLSLGFAPSVGNAFTLMNNDGADAVSGTFGGLPEGKVFTNSGAIFQISYIGGTGNDVVLYRVNPPAQLAALGTLPNGQVQIQGLGLANLIYTIQAATDLNPAMQWTDIGTVLANGSGQFLFTDTNTLFFPRRFLRVLSP